MPSTFISRRALGFRLTAIPVGLGAAARVFGASNSGLSHSSETIHQEIPLHADRHRVFDVLTDSKQFDAVTRLSDGVDLITAPGAKPTSISREAGGEFTLFGGYITGRNVELLPDERLVQAWRAGSWNPGEYSVARFALVDHGAGTKLIFDHRGFPEGQGVHLADGWHVHYWKPLANYLLRV
jgi:activator of HSP90 ATPase